MPVLIVVNDPKDMPLKFEGAETVTARTCLTDPAYAQMRMARIFNLCRSYRYQGVGYYVSLIAAARKHKPIPSITTIQDLKSPHLVRFASEELDDIIQKSLAPIQSTEFVLSIYFGRNLAKRHCNLSTHLFRLFPSPFLRAIFSYRKKDSSWYLKNITPLAMEEIPEEHRPFVVEVAQEFFRKRRPSRFRRVVPRYDLAILHNPAEEEPPSDPSALKRFKRAAESLGLATEFIEKEDYRSLAEYDALFIRETTSVTDHTYRFARKAVAEGMVVVDDPESILKCTNKVFLAELLKSHRVAMPRTVIVHRENADTVLNALGLPCVLKRPDSSFSRGVVRVETDDGFKENLDKLFDRSELVIAQEYLSTPFDWRVGVLDRQPLYVCKYYMTKKHWQIIKRDSAGVKTDEGLAETIPVEHAPPGLIRTALRAANLIGDGLYGVDVKQAGNSFYVVEINDNPNIDSGVEDLVLKDELYEKIMGVILRRIERLREGRRA